jgi:hypothetical protein
MRVKTWMTLFADNANSSEFLNFVQLEVEPRPLGAAFWEKYPEPVAPRGHDATRRKFKSNQPLV